MLGSSQHLSYLLLFHSFLNLLFIYLFLNLFIYYLIYLTGQRVAVLGPPQHGPRFVQPSPPLRHAPARSLRAGVGGLCVRCVVTRAVCQVCKWFQFCINCVYS